MDVLRIALLGVGAIGREFIKRTLQSPQYSFVAVGDTSGVIVDETGFGPKEMEKVVRFKEKGGKLREYSSSYHCGDMDAVIESCGIDVLVDVTDAQTFNLLIKALEHAHVVLSNKKPLADVSFPLFNKIVTKSREEGKILDFGTTIGAGMRIPDTIFRLGPYNLKKVSGCLSGTMNFLSQRINEGVPISVAIKEAMSPPRCYTEPDPRVDLAGEDFARKLVILGRICGRRVDRSMVNISDLVPTKLKTVPINKFLEELGDLDLEIWRMMEIAKKKEKVIWYHGSADFQKREYNVGFKEVPLSDPMTKVRESDNVLRLYPSNWRRPLTIMGPGAGPTETVTGLAYILSIIADNQQNL